VLHEIELEHLELSKLQKQRELLQKVEGMVGNKDREI
jgi:hypothetical protein